MDDRRLPPEDSEEVGRREAELPAARAANLDALRQRGIHPFKATRFEVTAHATDLTERYATLTAESPPQTELHSLAGGPLAGREMGEKAIWGGVWGGTGGT